ncbi:MAG: CynX/NimT family MFS transporter [Chloroflexota bacterium]
MGHKHQPAPYRWVNLIVYTLITFMAGMGFLAVAPLLDTIADRWSITFGAASLLLSVVGLFQFFLSIPVGWVTGKIGFKLPISIGATLLSIGYLLRATADSYTTFTMFTILAGLGWGVIWSPLGHLVATWFPASEIGLANSLWPVGFLAGQAFGSLTSIPFTATFGWSRTWLIYGLISTVIAALSWALLRSKPSAPPQPRSPVEPASLREGLHQTMNRTNVVLQYTVFASVGSLAVAPALVPPMLIARGVAPTLAGVVSGLALIGSTVGNLVIPVIAFRKGWERPLMLICALLGPIFFVGLFYVPVETAGPGIAILLSSLFGFVMAALMAISVGIGQLQPGVNPGNAAILAGVFLTSIGASATVFPSLVGLVVDLAGFHTAAWMLAALAAVSFGLLVAFVQAPEEQRAQ